ncbi:MAG: hypothetical protein V4850_27320 [Myxococcota bacterium]
MTRTLLPLALLLLSACTVDVLPVPNGDYVFAMAEPEGTADTVDGVLSIDTGALLLSLTDAEGAVEEWDLVAHDAGDRYTDCYTNYSHATMDAYSVDGSVVLAGVILDAPVLTTKCGGDVMLGAWAADGGAFDGPIFYFTPAG